jgi:hypothetical protein
MVRSIQFHMSRYLAAILGLCALTTSSVAAVVLPAQLAIFNQETQPPNTAPSNPAQDSQPASAPAETSQAPNQAQPDTAAKKPEPPAKAPIKKKKRRKSAGSSTATPQKKVVRNGGTADPVVQLAPGMSAEQASSQRQNTTQLLAATDANLKQISSRQMNSSQQDSISQIRKYMEQAKEAEQAGDVQRAHNLASKALLLSDDLVKH